MKSIENMKGNTSRKLEGKPTKVLNVLIVEDQHYTLINIKDALDDNMSNVMYDLAKWYDDAEARIKSGTSYDVILLDHRMPREKPMCDELKDFNGFCNLMENIGYGLIPIIKEYLPHAVIIGTSSLSKNEVNNSGYTLPEKVIKKVEAWDEIPRVFAEISIA